MTFNKISIGISAGFIIVAGLVFFEFSSKGNSDSGQTNLNNVSIEKTWELPDVLKEISGIAFIGDHKIAGVQDEIGTIFIYNLKTSTIENTIEFAGPGDFEGIAIANSTAYVLRADGTIFSVENYSSDPKTRKFETFLTSKQDVEGLAYDEENNRLLLAIKEEDPYSKIYKGVYAFNLRSMKARQKPVFKIALKDPIFENLDEKKLKNNFKPSEIGIHPNTGKMMLLEGKNPKLLLLDEEGNTEKLLLLDEDKFPQPEGLTFGPKGELYISNEGSPATIHRISLQ